MQKNHICKILAVGIICLFLLTPITSGIYRITEIKSSNNKLDDLPDLKIIDIKVMGHYERPWWCIVAVVLNDGTGPVPAKSEHTLRCIVKRPLLRNVVYDDSHTVGGSTPSIPPGDTYGFALWQGNPDTTIPGIYRVYFWVDPDNDIKESNENNNVVWAYYICRVLFYPAPQRISKIHQCPKLSLIREFPSNYDYDLFPFFK